MFMSHREPIDSPRRQPSSSDDATYAAAGHDHDEADESSKGRRRRNFSAQYKLRILREADACRAPGEIAALLRREGLWPSHLAAWRTARDKGALAALSPQPQRPDLDPEDRRIAELERENARLRARLEAAEHWLARQRAENRAMVRQAAGRGDQRAIVQLVQSTARVVGVREACRVLGVSRASYYRWQNALQAEFGDGPEGYEADEFSGDSPPPDPTSVAAHSPRVQPTAGNPPPPPPFRSAPPYPPDAAYGPYSSATQTPFRGPPAEYPPGTDPRFSHREFAPGPYPPYPGHPNAMDPRFYPGSPYPGAVPYVPGNPYPTNPPLPGHAPYSNTPRSSDAAPAPGDHAHPPRDAGLNTTEHGHQFAAPEPAPRDQNDPRRDDSDDEPPYEPT